ncbi:DNA-protecting protein DprA [Candidatus Peregrinibacteria bacterium]|jgi:DNA processing protein|nr:DNA-protecting protein DprA [Candidatus Peregrinibacteria bacterium]
MNSYLAAWAATDWITPIRLKKVLKVYGDLKTAWKNICLQDLIKMKETEKSIQKLLELKKNIIPEKECEKNKIHGISLMYIHDGIYPSKLKEISSPPVFLYYQGEWKDDFDISLAVIGTRRVSAYGKQVVENLVPQLASKLTIVSGLAIGIDTLSHQACLHASGKTIAVLGGSLENIYPSANKNLAQRILDTGGMLISEFPPGTEARPFHFPRRNRIISGLSLGALVIEGQEKSGSLITARMALEQNREVFAVPGNIYSSQSTGTNQLIQKGEAKLVKSAEDVFDELQIEQKKEYQEAKKQLKFSSETEEKIYNSLSHEGLDINQISEITNLETTKVSSSLTLMEIKGLVKNIGSGMWVRKI